MTRGGGRAFVSRCRRPAAGRSTPDCGRRRRHRYGAPAAIPWRGRGRDRADTPRFHDCRVLPLPDQARGGMRRTAQRVVGDRPDAGADLIDLTTDGDHRLDEIVELREIFTLGGLDHQGARHREAHRRRVETVVGQPLCHIIDGDAGLLGDLAQIENALVGDHAVLAGVEHREVVVQPAGDVVGRRDRRQRRPAQAVGAHHPDVGPGDGQNRGRTVFRRRHRVRTGLQRIAGQILRQMRTHRHRSDARTAAAVRDAEGLVQIQMADVAAEPARPRQAHQRVQVRTVDVDLPARLVHQRAQFGDLVLVHAVRRRIGDHDAGQPVGVIGDLGAQIVQVDVAVVAAGHHLDPQPRHGRRRRVRAVRAGRDQAGVTVSVAAIEVIAANRQQTRVLALAARVGLQAHRVVAGDRRQPALQIGDQPQQAGASSTGAYGCTRANPGQVIASISAVAFSFMVQEPSGIMLRSKAMSLSASRRR